MEKVNLENSFWKEFPELKIHLFFNDFYNSDIEEKTSKIMWGLYLVLNPESQLFNDPNKETAVAKNLIKDKSFKWSDYEDHKKHYKELALTPAQRSLINWSEVMELRDSSVKQMYKDAIENSNVASVVNLDRVLSATPKMFADYDKIMKQYNEEKTKKKGSKINSLSDNDEI